MNFSTLTTGLPSVTSIRIWTAIFSLFFSIWAYHLDVVLNADGILYIYTIDAFKSGGLAATESLYNWPFFPIITAWLSELTGWSTEFSVKALNSILFMLLTDALVLLSHKSLPHLRQLTIGAVLILGFYALNEYRDFIIRDIGYWAFACYALLQFLNYLENRQLRHALLWQFFIIIALLFRIEAIVFIALVPLYVLISDNTESKWRALITLYSVTLTLSAITLFLAWLHPDTATAFSKLKQLLIYFSPDVMLADFENGARLLEQEILHPAADEHAGRVLVFGLVLTILWELLAGLSISYLILLGMSGFAFKRLINAPHQRFFIFVILINIALLSVFAIKSQLITTRYCVLGLLFILLALLPTLTNYILQKIDLKQKKILALVSFLVFASIADTLIATQSKPHLRTIPTWAAENLPQNARILTTELTIEYYFNTNRQGSALTLARDLTGIQSYDYLIAELKNGERPDLPMIENLSLQLVREDGNTDNRVAIFKVRQKN